jgi:N-succinyl-L-ornithine transcarbamylase
MNNYISIHDILDPLAMIKDAIALKNEPFQFEAMGRHKTLVMLFLNSSLRTRLSTEKAAKNLGMDVMILNLDNAWNLEFEDGSIMNMGTSEHIKEAAKVISQYADIIAIRAFPGLVDKTKDESEIVINNFKTYASVPIINMESSTAHPLQALTDAITITELAKKKKPKVVLSWAPHPKALPHAVANSFVEMMQRLNVDFQITHPEGYELNPEITKDSAINYNQEVTLRNADFVYVKNWSNYKDYGKVLSKDPNWMMTKNKLGNARFMHCLPVRRNVVVEDSVLDSPQSVVIEQANNRIFAAQVVLKTILENQ